MKWEQVREQYPEQWVLVEAISAYSNNSICYIEELSVISNFPESTIAWKEYKKLHLANPSREYYIFHTDHKTIEVKEQKFIGVRRRLLGITKETYGFNGILGNDFMIRSGLVIDLKEKTAYKK